MMKALIVEDELLESVALVHILRTYYQDIFTQVLSARDGQEAIATVKREEPDLVFMDINLPVLNGLEASKHICAHYPNIKIIMISAYSDYLHLRESMRNNAVDYIVKPYSVETLREAVGRVLVKTEKVELYGKGAVVERAKNYLETHYSQN
ncbi:MAG: response regulator, partial [Oscillospiraceae bacterium]|nr:response regulator [Oscillospiraceae bacterium]